jgi:hypothetical protein
LYKKVKRKTAFFSLWEVGGNHYELMSKKVSSLKDFDILQGGEKDMEGLNRLSTVKLQCY